jgi:hypothetical protein
MAMWRSNQLCRFVATVLLAFSVTSSAYGQSRPNLSGRWQSIDQPAQINVEQDDRLFIVSTIEGGGRMKNLSYRLDGSESSNTVITATGGTWTHTSRATWVNSALAITTTTATETGARWEWMQVYLLDPRGHLSVTTIDGIITDARAMSVSTFVYDREQSWDGKRSGGLLRTRSIGATAERTTWSTGRWRRCLR